jgi:hypothetical protein
MPLAFVPSNTLTGYLLNEELQDSPRIRLPQPPAHGHSTSISIMQ